MPHLLSSLHTPLRRLLRTPAFAALTVLTLAIGLAANTAIFSVVWAVLLRPLPFDDPDRLVVILNHAPALDVGESVPQSPEGYVLIRDRTRTLEAVGLLDDIGVSLTGREEPRRARASRATSSVFDLLGTGALIGRAFGPDDDAPGGPALVLLSHELWSGELGRDPDVIGRSLEIDGTPHEIVGVMPAGFRDLYEDTELWLPFRIDESELPQISFSHQMIGRLAPEVGIAEASREVEGLMLQLPEVFPGGLTEQMMRDARWSASARALHDEIVGDLARTLWVLLGAVAFVLLVACANVANLFVVRGEGRQREVALRVALGAGRGDLARHFLSESVAVGLLSGVVALGLAWLGVEALLALAPVELPRVAAVGLSAPVVGFTLLLAVGSGLAFGLFPLVRAIRAELTSSLKEGGRGGSASRSGIRTRNLLVICQVALAAVLLVGSGLLLRSFHELRTVDPGFEARGVLTFELALPEATYPDDEARLRFWTTLSDRLAAIPGAEAVGTVQHLPLSGRENNTPLMVEGQLPEPGGLPDVVRTVGAGPGFFASMGIEVVAGRPIREDDLRDGGRVAVVSRSLAEKLWPDGTAVGRRVSQEFTPDGTVESWMTVVGVVEDVRDGGLDSAPSPTIYPTHSYATPEGEVESRSTMVAVVRTSRPTGPLGATVRRAVWDLDPKLPVIEMRSTAEIVRSAMASTTFAMLLVGIAAVVALVLGMVGLYAVVSYVVGQRTREIGVRMALGAAGGEVRRMIVAEGVGVALVGVVLGVGGALALGGAVESLLFGVSVTDPVAFAAASLLLLSVAAFAAYLPARRASRIDPKEALRQE